MTNPFTLLPVKDNGLTSCVDYRFEDARRPGTNIIVTHWVREHHRARLGEFTFFVIRRGHLMSADVSDEDQTILVAMIRLLHGDAS